LSAKKNKNTHTHKGYELKGAVSETIAIFKSINRFVHDNRLKEKTTYNAGYLP